MFTLTLLFQTLFNTKSFGLDCEPTPLSETLPKPDFMLIVVLTPKSVYAEMSPFSFVIVKGLTKFTHPMLTGPLSEFMLRDFMLKFG